MFGVPIGFDALPATPSGQLANALAADSNNRMFVSSGGVGANSEKIRFIDDTGTAFTDANPSTDSIFVSGIVGLSTGPEGSVWAGVLGNSPVLRRMPGATSWVATTTGLPIAIASTMTAPGFDAAGNGYVLFRASAGTTTSQLYKLPAAGSAWAAFGPAYPGISLTSPVILADGTIYVSNNGIGGNFIHSLDAAGTAYTVVTNQYRGVLVLGKDGTVYGLVGAGSGTKVVSKAPAASAFVDAQALGVSGQGATDPRGICVHPSGDVYALTVKGSTGSGLWRRAAATGVWEQLVLNPVPPTSATSLGCAPNGRLYAVWNNLVHRSKP